VRLSSGRADPDVGGPLSREVALEPYHGPVKIINLTNTDGRAGGGLLFFFFSKHMDAKNARPFECGFL
jgi:hypothetical protein